MSAERIACFKAYDVRGRVPDELDADLAERIGRAFAGFLGSPRRVAVGYDIRLSSPEIAEAVTRGLNAAGVDVVQLGCCGTEQVYFATFHLELDGGVMVTASHNPADYNGLKLVRGQARPISSDTGLAEIERMVREGDLPRAERAGSSEPRNLDAEFVRHLLACVDPADLEPLKIVVNAGNGGAGAVVDLLDQHLPFEFVRLLHEPDGHFPNGVPNPLLPENRSMTADAVVAERADVGIAWDGDFDRCFFFDERGEFIEGYYLVGLLAEFALEREPGSTIVHDPRLIWNTLEIVEAHGGTAAQCKSGHAFMKDVMRRENAAYGGEMSAHHYFRRFAFCDSGMIPWMQVLQMIGRRGRSLASLVGDRIERFPASGEINRRLRDPRAALTRVRSTYERSALRVDETDGIGIDFEHWRFNLRLSNTEPLIRLNVESRGDRALMEAKTREVLTLLEAEG